MMSGALAIATLTTTSTEVIARSGCTNQIVSPTTPVGGTEGCGSYTDCEAGAQCLPTGGRFESCGQAESFPRYCKNYIDGYYNQETGRCEGGNWVGPGYADIDNYVLMYNNPEFCATLNPA